MNSTFEIIASAVTSFLCGVGLEKLKNKKDKKTKLALARLVISHYYDKCEGDLKKSHQAYKTCVLINKKILKNEASNTISIPAKINIDEIKTHLSILKYENKGDITKAINSLVALAEETNKFIDYCTQHLQEQNDSSVKYFFGLFDSLCQFMYLITKLKNEDTRFIYDTRETNQQIAEKVALSYKLPYHIQEVISNHIHNK